MNREDVNKEFDCKIPATFDIGQHVSGYISMRNGKRQAILDAGARRPDKPLNEDAFEVFLSAMLSYAKKMPDSPLMIIDHQAAHIIRKLKIYKSWDVSRDIWDTHWDRGVMPSLMLNGRKIVVEESVKPEQKTLFA